MRRTPDKRPRLDDRIRAAWGQVIVYLRHPRRWVVPVVGAALLCGLVYWRLVEERVPWQLGQRALRTVTADVDVRYEDTAATARKKQEARQSTPEVYDERKAAAAGESRRTINSIFALTLDARREEETDLARLNHLRDLLQIPLGHEALSTLVTAPEAQLPVIEDRAVRLAAARMAQPIKDVGDDLEKARATIAAEAAKVREEPAVVSTAVEIAQRAVLPNQVFNASRTADAQDEAEKRIGPVRMLLRRNEVVIAAGDRVEQSHLDMLGALGKMTPGEAGFALRVLVAVLTVVALLLVLGYYFRRYRPAILASPRRAGLVVAALVVAAVVARMGARGELSEATDLAAVSAMAIVLAALLDTEVAMVASVFMAFFASMVAPGSDPRLLVAATTAGTVAAFAAGAGGTRTSVIARTALVCGALNGFLVGAVSAAFGLALHSQPVLFAAAGGVLASLVAAGAIALLERPLKITTELRLLELSNPNEAILKRLTVEAPGTYASSVAVANLAEAAAEAVGADALLVRVGSYYHDIGKLKRPYYFIENQQGGPNPHDRLTSHLSARVIIAHVRDGLEIAEEVGLPAEIRTFIAQHHGATLVEYFYEKALQAAGDPPEVLESAFRYEGPRPQAREAAIVMIADTVEAASRTLSNPDLDAIRTLVRNLIQHKVDDGQFDQCNLTFADIHTIQDALVRSLGATFHQRVKYPAQLEDMRPEERGSRNGNGRPGARARGAHAPNGAPKDREEARHRG